MKDLRIKLYATSEAYEKICKRDDPKLQQEELNEVWKYVEKHAQDHHTCTLHSGEGMLGVCIQPESPGLISATFFIDVAHVLSLEPHGSYRSSRYSPGLEPSPDVDLGVLDKEYDKEEE